MIYEPMYRPIAGHRYRHHYCLRCGRAFTSPAWIVRMSHWCGSNVVALQPAIARLLPETEPRRAGRRVRVRRGKK